MPADRKEVGVKTCHSWTTFSIAMERHLESAHSQYLTVPTKRCLQNMLEATIVCSYSNCIRDKAAFKLPIFAVLIVFATETALQCHVQFKGQLTQTFDLLQVLSFLLVDYVVYLTNFRTSL